MNIKRQIVASCIVLAGAAWGDAAPGWRVAELNGAPGLWHDGKPVPAMMFWQWEPQEKDTRDMSAAGVELFTMFGEPCSRDPYWREDGSFGMAFQDRHIDNLLSWGPSDYGIVTFNKPK